MRMKTGQERGHTDVEMKGSSAWFGSLKRDEFHFYHVRTEPQAAWDAKQYRPSHQELICANQSSHFLSRAPSPSQVTTFTYSPTCFTLFCPRFLSDKIVQAILKLSVK